MTERYDVEKIREDNDLLTAIALTCNLRQITSSESAGPCPKCGGDDRFHCTDDWWFCRQCHTKRGDVIGFTQWMHNVDFKTACAMLNGEIEKPTARPIRQAPPAQRPHFARERVGAQLADWQAALHADGNPGAEYLSARGLDNPTVWATYGLGYDASASIPGTHGQRRAPAIAMPWFRGGKLVAVRYRFLEPQDGHKQAAVINSRFSGLLYGGQAICGCAEDLRTLVICEGELNAISIHQVAANTNVDVLSLGSESARLTPAMIAYAEQFRAVVLWMDRSEVCDKLLSTMPSAFGICSDDLCDRDANDLLQDGTLGGILAGARYGAERHSANRQALLWDLFDGGLDPYTIDSGTQRVSDTLRAELRI